MAKGEKDLESVVKKKKGLWSVSKIFMLFLLIFGFIIGVYVTYEFIEPAFNEQLHSKLAICEAKQSIQEEQLNAYIKCLEKNEINLNECD
ncbi:hypothetical protein KJ660_03240 [Candidatus Micrarchaeota archaeon]|nr:hypothetical protein [Candidatus Micrarchaeota archaeon]